MQIEVTQDLVDRIVKRAMASNLGLNEPDQPKALKLKNYQPSMQSLAMMLISAYYEKYDLISIVWAAMEEMQAEFNEYLDDAGKERNLSERD